VNHALLTSARPKPPLMFVLHAGTRAAACGIHSFAKSAAVASGASLRPYGAGAAMLMVAGAAMLGETCTS
jgi:hypothetical protein